MSGKTDRRLLRIEQRMAEVERLIGELKRVVDYHGTFIMGDEPLPVTKPRNSRFRESVKNQAGPGNSRPSGSVMDRLSGMIVEAGVDTYGDPGPFGVAEEAREEGDPEPSFVHRPVKNDVVIESPDAVVNVVASAKRTLSPAELEQAAYELSEEGRDWKEVEEELGLKCPWLAAGRWRKRIERGEV